MFNNPFLTTPATEFYRNQMNQIAQPQFAPMPNMSSFGQPQYVVRQVSNVDEAKNFIVDAFSTCLFLDPNAGKVYLKRMASNGLSEFNVFALEKPIEQNQEGKPTPLEMIDKRLSNIENKLMGGSNDQSVTDGAKSVNAEGTTAEPSNVRKVSSDDEW